MGSQGVLKNLSCPCQDEMNALRKSGRRNFDQVVAQREVGCFVDALEHERFFKRDFSRRSLLAEPQMFDEEHLPLVNPLTLNSREFLSQSSRGRIAQIAGKRERAYGRTVIPLEVGRCQRRFELSLFLQTHNGIDEVGPQVRLQIATTLLTSNDLGGSFLHHAIALAFQLMQNGGFSCTRGSGENIAFHTSRPLAKCGNSMIVSLWPFPPQSFRITPPSSLRSPRGLEPRGNISHEKMSFV